MSNLELTTFTAAELFVVGSHFEKDEKSLTPEGWKILAEYREKEIDRLRSEIAIYRDVVNNDELLLAHFVLKKQQKRTYANQRSRS